MSSLKSAALSCVLATVVAAPCLAGEAPGEYDYDEDMLSAEEQATLELKRRREAKSVLACEPRTLRAEAKPGETATLQLTVRNDGGKNLRWSVRSVPEWLSLGKRSGELGFEGKETLTARVKRWSVGTVRGSVVLEAPGAANSPLTIPITLSIRRKELPREPTRIKPPVSPRRRTREPRVSRPRTPRQERRGRLGVHLGYMLPGSGDQTDYDSAPLFGLHYSHAGTESSRLSFEVGLDYLNADASDGSDSSELYVGRLNLLIGSKNGTDNRAYFFTGLGWLRGSSNDGSANAGTLDLGGGYSLADRRVDLRVAYSVLLGSENTKGMTSIGVAYNF